jgi:hypothetical protein
MNQPINIEIKSANEAAAEVYKVIVNDLGEAVKVVSTDATLARSLKLELMEMVAQLENVEGRARS